MRSANLNVVALVIHDHAGTHVPVQYIQALYNWSIHTGWGRSGIGVFFI